jgi:hypothetical protein
MRRSSTTASLATVRRRLQGEKLLQNSSEANSPSNLQHQDDPHRVDVEPGGVDLHGEGQNCANDEQEDAEADPTVTPPQTLRICRQGCCRQVMPSSEEPF